MSNDANTDQAAVNDNIIRGTKTRHTAEGVPTPEYQIQHNHVLAIAVDRYDDDGIPNLNNCLNDIEDLLEILTTHYFFERDNIHFLRSRNHTVDQQKKSENKAREERYANTVAEATHDNIIYYLRKLAGTLTKEDNLIICFSGHGIYDEVFNEGYWIPSDGRLDYNSSYIENGTIRTALNAIKTHHTVLISDSCYSGTLFPSLETRSLSVPRIYKLASRWGITAGRFEPVSDGALGGNSPFAKALLDVLERRTEIWISDLVNEVIKELTDVNKEDQTPAGEALSFIEGHENGQFVFMPKLATEEDYWMLTWHEDQNLRTDYYSFLARYPDGDFETLALKALSVYADDRTPIVSHDGRQMYAFLKEELGLDYALRYVELYLDDKIPAFKSDEVQKTHLFLKEHHSDDQAVRYLYGIAEGKVSAVLTEDIEQEYFDEGQSDAAAAKDYLKYMLLDSFVDQRDGKRYRTVEIDGIVWMAENLNYKLEADGCWYYDDKPSNAAIYGCLYSWDAAKKACPEGWRLPTKEEWEKLATYYGGGYFEGITQQTFGDPAEVYKALIEGGESGFNANKGGYRLNNGTFHYIGKDGFYWAETSFNEEQAWSYSFFNFNQSINRDNNPKDRAYSCKCVRKI